MSRVATPAEKVLATAGIFHALATELQQHLNVNNPVVQVGLLDIAVRIAMATDTRDMGLMTPASRNAGEFTDRIELHDDRCICPLRPTCEPHGYAGALPEAGESISEFALVPCAIHAHDNGVIYGSRSALPAEGTAY